MADLKLILGNKNYSSWSLRPWLAMRQTGIEFEEVVVPLYEPGSNARLFEFSPAGRVPVLQAGDTTIWESMAIVEYVADLHPEKRLWPADREVRAQARAVSHEMHAGFAALRSAMPMNMRREPAQINVSKDVHKDIARIEAIWADCRARFGGEGAFLFGDFTIADAMYAPVASRFKSYAVEVGDVSRAYMNALFDTKAYDEWREAGLAETWVIKSCNI